jgi:hypothetical protein
MTHSRQKTNFIVKPRWLLIATLAILAALILARLASGAPVVQHYVNFGVTPDKLDLGSAPGQGVYNSPAELKVHITANCAHSGLILSVSALTRTGGEGSIGPERISVRLPATGNYVPITAPVCVTGPMNPGIADVILKFRVETTMADNPGNYAGTIVITCAAAP